MKTHLRLILSVLLVLTMLFAAIPDAPALTIVRNFGGGAPPGNAAGGGNLADIFDAAADWWELAILDVHTVTISFSWATLGGGTLGVHRLLTQDGTPNRETSGTILFNNDGSSVWFMDPTPYDHSEYLTFTETSADLGGGVINTGRVHTNPTGFAVGRYDLLTAAKHEIGHALGLSSANTSFTVENADFDIDVVGPRLFAGTVIPTIFGAHLNIGSGSTGALMYPSLSAGVRKVQSAVDILANAEISDFNTLNLNLEPIPEPGTFVLLCTGLGGIAFISYRRRKA